MERLSVFKSNEVLTEIKLPSGNSSWSLPSSRLMEQQSQSIALDNWLMNCLFEFYICLSDWLTMKRKAKKKWLLWTTHKFSMSEKQTHSQRDYLTQKHFTFQLIYNLIYNLAPRYCPYIKHRAYKKSSISY